MSLNTTPTCLTGRTTRATIESFPGWQQLRAQDYTPKAAAIDVIREHVEGVEVWLFTATWCGDSRRDLPRFFKIMDQVGWPESKVTIIGLDHNKKDPEGLAAQWKILSAPTFVFIKGGRELGRIVERPWGTLEGDIARILASN
jgi:thiol-disulfide isomerase/thioredoxin